MLLAAHHGLPPDSGALLVQGAVWLLIVLLAFPSGGHLNSAITVGVWSSGQMPLLEAVLFIGAQARQYSVSSSVQRSTTGNRGI